MLTAFSRSGLMLYPASNVAVKVQVVQFQSNQPSGPDGGLTEERDQ